MWNLRRDLRSIVTIFDYKDGQSGEAVSKVVHHLDSQSGKTLGSGEFQHRSHLSDGTHQTGSQEGGISCATEQ